MRMKTGTGRMTEARTGKVEMTGEKTKSMEMTRVEAETGKVSEEEKAYIHWLYQIGRASCRERVY